MKSSFSDIKGLREDVNGPKLPFVTTTAPRVETEANSKLVKRFTNGMCSNRYYQNDYQTFEAMKYEITKRGNRQLEKLRHIERARKQNKDINSIKQHKLVWRKHHTKLTEAISRLEDEIMTEMEDSIELFNFQTPSAHEGGESPFQEPREYKDLLNVDTKDFRANLLSVISDLRNEIDNLYYEKNGIADEIFEDLQQRLEDFKADFYQMEDNIGYEINSLEVDLTEFSEFQDARAKNCGYDWEGIPLELLTADFPHDSLWSSLMAEIVLLDENFKQRLRDLDVEFLHVVGNVTGGWDTDDHMRFEVIREQYNAYDLQNSHNLFLDRLKRQFPLFGMETLLTHDRWCTDAKAYQLKKQGILKTWQQSKEQLTLKVSASLEEAALKWEEIQRHNLERENQIIHCRELLQKVNAWKEAKEEEQKLQDELNMLQMQREREKLQIKLQREKDIRDAQKRDIENYRNEKKHLGEEAERIKMAKLQEIQENLAKQAVIDKQRIQFRRGERDKKLEQMCLDKERRQQERERLESRLEQLRSQVRVEAPRDAERMVQATVASGARYGVGTLPESVYEPLQSELFSVNTFKEASLKRDNRTKIETALRKAGLHTTDYGRSILQKIEPPQKPRKDTFSNIKFGNE